MPHIKFILFLLCSTFIWLMTNGQSTNEVSFFPISGFHENEIDVQLSGFDSIYYTVNNEQPTLSSNLYTDPVRVPKSFPNQISLIQSTHLSYEDHWPNNEFGFQPPTQDLRKCTTIKARGFKDGILQNDVFEAKYFITNSPHSFPTFCVDLDSLALFDFDSGIYLPGQFWDHENPGWTGNYYQRGDEWEKPALVTYFDEFGEQKFSLIAGIRVSGNGSRRKPQKSLKLYFRSEYGENDVPNLFFPERNFDRYKRLVLRTPFTYWYWSGGRNLLFQDALIHRIVWECQADLEVSLSKPASVYLNGEYWGIQNIRETHDKFFLSDLTGAERDDINLVDGATLVPRDGDSTQFVELMEFVLNNDLAISSNYEHVTSKIDLRNYIDYYVMQTYFGNKDWPINNHLVWNIQSKNSPFRWFFFDLDGAMDEVDLDPFLFMDSGTDYPSVFFRKIMENEDFRSLFLERYNRHLQNGLRTNRTIEILDEFIALYKPEIENHINRWNNPLDYSSWNKSCLAAYRFFEQRPCLIKDVLQERFGKSQIQSFDCGYHQTDFEVYPNPVSNVLNLKFDSTAFIDSELIIVNSLGTKVSSKKITSMNQLVDVSDLQSGIYIALVVVSEQQIAQKFVVN